MTSMKDSTLGVQSASRFYKHGLWLLLIIITLSGCRENYSLYLFDLKTENLHNPLAIDAQTPRFSWKLSQTYNGNHQTAFQVLVASHPDLLTETTSDLWNSGRVESIEQVLVPYEGAPLMPGTLFYWKVRVWDAQGKASPWSEMAEAGIGLLSAVNWQARYIGMGEDGDYSDSPQMFTRFSLPDSPGRQLLHVNSLGYHEVYVNGIKVGRGVLTPAVSEFTRRSLINTYDLAPYTHPGVNTLMIWLGSGWYSYGLPGVEHNGTLLRAQLELVEGSNRQVLVATNSDWMVRRSSYRRHGTWRSNQFGGEIVDGAMQPFDLDFDSPEANVWTPAAEVFLPEKLATPQMAELNAITDTLYAHQVLALADGVWLVDMGTNLTGWVEIDFGSVAKGETIRIEYADHLKANGEFNDRNYYDLYYGSGTDKNIFINRFNHHGFRYLRISGPFAEPLPEQIRGYLVHQDFEITSGFVSSDTDLNQIHDMLQYTLKCLSLGGYIVDCPQIERLGYGGDGNASTKTAQIMFGLAPLYHNWMQSWEDVMRDDGGMPHTAPNPYPAGGGPYWTGFLITGSYRTYLQYGDTQIIRRHYDAMKKWLTYVEKHRVDGLLKRWPDTDYRAWYLGDWATPEGIDQTHQTSVDLVNNCFVAVCLDTMSEIARLLNNSEDAQYFALEAKELKEIIHKEFFDEKGGYGTFTQIDLSYPLLAGVVPDSLLPVITSTLEREIRIDRQGHFACGLVGIPVLTEWLTQDQSVDLFYEMLKKRTYPGYLYMIDNGATTTWEHWDGARSHIHNCYNGIGSWFYEALAGVTSSDNQPALRKIRIAPQVPEGLEWIKSWRSTPYGKLVVDWQQKGKWLYLDVEIPPGTEATIPMPNNGEVYLNGKKVKGLDYPRELNLLSGSHTVRYSIEKL